MDPPPQIPKKPVVTRQPVVWLIRFKDGFCLCHRNILKLCNCVFPEHVLGNNIRNCPITPSQRLLMHLVLCSQGSLERVTLTYLYLSPISDKHEQTVVYLGNLLKRICVGQVFRIIAVEKKLNLVLGHDQPRLHNPRLFPFLCLLTWLRQAASTLSFLFVTEPLWTVCLTLHHFSEWSYYFQFDFPSLWEIPWFVRSHNTCSILNVPWYLLPQLPSFFLSLYSFS